MIKILKIYGEPIINYWDLKNAFAPLEIYKQLEAFTEFAAVHCVPLPLQITDPKTGGKYIAEYLTKQFWLDIFSIVNWKNDADIFSTFKTIVDDRVIKIADSDEFDSEEDGMDTLIGSFEKEIKECNIQEKLKHISDLCSGTNQYRKWICLLAISELAEIDVLQTENSLWKDETQPVKAKNKIPAVHHDGMEMKRNVKPESQKNASKAVEKVEISKSDILYFNYDKEIKLLVGNEPFKYWYYDSDSLNSGEIIHTVRIEAQGSSNQYAVLKLELYSELSKSCIQRITLKKGEWVYCNVVHGKIIKFLPGISLSDDLCLLRSSYGEENIMVYSPDAEPWSININDISSFSAGNRRQGFLIVEDGKINYKFYKASADYFTKLQLDMVVLPVVEANVAEDGYELLLENGSVVSDCSKYERLGVVSLTPSGRRPFIRLKGPTKYSEVAISRSKKSVGILSDLPKRENVLFQSDNKKFKISAQTDYVEVLL